MVSCGAAEPTCVWWQNIAAGHTADSRTRLRAARKSQADDTSERKRRTDTRNIISGKPVRYAMMQVALLVVCLIAFSACDIPIIGGGLAGATTTPQPVTPLSGTSWALSELIVAGHSQTLAPTTPITLQFQRGSDTYLGSSGCNYYNGAYSVAGDQLHLQFGSVTQRACASPIMSQEVAYLNAMDDVRSFHTDRKTLTLQDGHGKAMLVYGLA